ncbi:hypothetical protein F01_480352 [Burkholderia cenocepacia]|nr:hypothetical protein F01_480352 [Burkholderia cenocepacia]
MQMILITYIMRTLVATQCRGPQHDP